MEFITNIYHILIDIIIIFYFFISNLIDFVKEIFYIVFSPFTFLSSFITNINLSATTTSILSYNFLNNNIIGIFSTFIFVFLLVLIIRKFLV